MSLFSYNIKSKANLSRAVFTLFLVLVIYKDVEFLSILDRFANMGKFYFFLSFLAYSVGIILRGVKYYTSLILFDSKVNYFRTVLTYIVSVSYAPLMPSGLAEDKFKISCLGKEKINNNIIAGSNYDRISNFLCLLILSIFFGALNFTVMSQNQILLKSYYFVGATFILVMFFIKYSETIFRKRVPEIANSLLNSKQVIISKCNEKISLLVCNFGLCALFNLIGMAGMYYLIGESLNITTVPTSYYLYFIPLITIFHSIPITIGGYGFRELGFLILFRQVGIEESEALLFPISYYVIFIIGSILNAIIMKCYEFKDI